MRSPPPEIPEGLEHMLPLFVAEMVKDAARLAELARDLSDNDPLENLAEHAHAMRGKAGLFGEQCLYGLLTRLEQSALAGDVAPLPELVTLVVERSDQLELYGREMATGPA